MVSGSSSPWLLIFYGNPALSFVDATPIDKRGDPIPISCFIITGNQSQNYCIIGKCCPFYIVWVWTTVKSGVELKGHAPEGHLCWLPVSLRIFYRCVLPSKKSKPKTHKDWRKPNYKNFLDSLMGMIVLSRWAVREHTWQSPLDAARRRETARYSIIH